MSTAKNRLLLEDKVAIVTGASYGIGQAIAVALARQGADIVLVARGEPGEALEEGGYFGKEYVSRGIEKIEQAGRRAFFHPTDISNPDSVKSLHEAVVHEFGHVEVLVNAASTLPEDVSVEDVDLDAIEGLANTTVKGTILITQSFLPLLKASQGHIIFIASDWALRGSGGWPVFSAAKAAVAQFARTLSRRVLKDGVKVTTIYPGDVASYDPGWEEPKYDIDTPYEELERDFAEYAREEGLEIVPLRVHPAQIAETVIFVLERKTARVEELVITPIYASYDYTKLELSQE